MNVDERVAKRGEAIPEVAGELLWRHGLDGVEHAFLRPVVIIEQLAQVLVVHRHTPDINDKLSASSGNFINTSVEVMAGEHPASSASLLLSSPHLPPPVVTRRRCRPRRSRR